MGIYGIILGIVCLMIMYWNYFQMKNNNVITTLSFDLKTCITINMIKT